ncbi:MAG TPA: PIG-L family deacetylase [Candidatus Elarobacter sp.]|jgi:LmbE family N-acetylglucosaminyl deacetylase|nr:PIG-L family deacetylase [Candidatus Elarobacter sp.]
MERAETFLRGFERVVVVAPHPDDDVLGCGGTLAAAALLGLATAAVYVTDGAASHLGSPSYPPDRLRAVREREAREALDVLGVAGEPRFLRVPDGTTAQLDDRAAEGVVSAIAGAAGDGRVLVLGPWQRDHHTDHVAVARLVRRACALRPNATLLEYAIWLDERGTAADRPAAEDGAPLALDVTAHAEAKAAALARHRSQLGTLIGDARETFALPPGVLAAAARPAERFVRVVLPLAR